jgi:hypothetical protein
MAESQLGDVAETKLPRVTVPAVISVTGPSYTGHHVLTELPDIKHYFDVYGNVKIIGPILVEVFGPVTTTQANVVVCAFYPDKYSDHPTTASQVSRLEGRVHSQQSLAFGSQSAAPAFPRETTTILKPATLVDHPPVFAYHLDAPGATASSVSTITLHITLEVSGACHKKTW